MSDGQQSLWGAATVNGEKMWDKSGSWSVRLDFQFNLAQPPFNLTSSATSFFVSEPCLD